MKIKMTRNQVKAMYPHVYNVGYCELQRTLSDLRPVGYARGVCGWNYDVYDLGGGIAVLTGYRGTFGEDIPYGLTRGLDGDAFAGSRLETLKALLAGKVRAEEA